MSLCISTHARIETSNLSQFFIENILHRERTDFDFSMEHIQYLCQIEPAHCQHLLDSLAISATRKAISDNRKAISNTRTTVSKNRPGTPPTRLERNPTKQTVNAVKPAISEGYVNTENDKLDSVGNEDYELINAKQDYSYEALSNIAGPGRNIFQLLGLPRHVLLLGFIPLFPLMLLFTASGGAAFFLTTGVEFILR